MARRRGAFAAGALVTTAILAVLLPFLWVLLASFKPPELLARPEVVAFAPDLRHWRAVLLESDVPRYALNSLMVGAGTVAIALLVATPAAYTLSRWRTGGASVRFAILAAEMLPPAVVIVPLFLILWSLALTNSLIAVVLAHLTFVLPVVTWFLIGFIDDLPRELEEQAMIDGYSRLQAFLRVVVPALRPGLGAAAVLGFVLSWNDMFYALILTGGASKTLPVAIAGYWTFRGIEMGKMAVAILLSVVPVTVAAFFVQKHLVRGLGGGALKM